MFPLTTGRIRAQGQNGLAIALLVPNRRRLGRFLHATHPAALDAEQIAKEEDAEWVQPFCDRIAVRHYAKIAFGIPFASAANVWI